METNFQLLMLSPNLIKSKIPMSGRGGGGQFPTFDAESKFAKKVFRQNSAWEWFWTLSTKWFAYTKYTREPQQGDLMLGVFMKEYYKTYISHLANK